MQFSTIVRKPPVVAAYHQRCEARGVRRVQAGDLVRYGVKEGAMASLVVEFERAVAGPCYALVGESCAGQASCTRRQRQTSGAFGNFHSRSSERGGGAVVDARSPGITKGGVAEVRRFIGVASERW